MKTKIVVLIVGMLVASVAMIGVAYAAQEKIMSETDDLFNVIKNKKFFHDDMLRVTHFLAEMQAKRADFIKTHLPVPDVNQKKGILPQDLLASATEYIEDSWHAVSYFKPNPYLNDPPAYYYEPEDGYRYVSQLENWQKGEGDTVSFSFKMTDVKNQFWYWYKGYEEEISLEIKVDRHSGVVREVIETRQSGDVYEITTGWNYTSKTTIITTYDKNGRLEKRKEERSDYENGNLFSVSRTITDYAYDGKGNLKKATMITNAYDGKGALIGTVKGETSYTYDKDGRLIKVEALDQGKPNPSYIGSETSGRMLLVADFISHRVTTYTYDSNGVLTETAFETHESFQGEEVFTTHGTTMYVWDENGRLKEQSTDMYELINSVIISVTHSKALYTYTESGDLLTMRETRDHYDGNGNLIEHQEIWYDNPKYTEPPRFVLFGAAVNEEGLQRKAVEETVVTQKQVDGVTFTGEMAGQKEQGILPLQQKTSDTK